jgi:hypothetical protein
MSSFLVIQPDLDLIRPTNLEEGQTMFGNCCLSIIGVTSAENMMKSNKVILEVDGELNVDSSYNSESHAMISKNDEQKAIYCLSNIEENIIMHTNLSPNKITNAYCPSGWSKKLFENFVDCKGISEESYGLWLQRRIRNLFHQTKSISSAQELRKQFENLSDPKEWDKDPFGSIEMCYDLEQQAGRRGMISLVAATMCVRGTIYLTRGTVHDATIAVEIFKGVLQYADEHVEVEDYYVALSSCQMAYALMAIEQTSRVFEFLDYMENVRVFKKNEQNLFLQCRQQVLEGLCEIAKHAGDEKINV